MTEINSNIETPEVPAILTMDEDDLRSLREYPVLRAGVWMPLEVVDQKSTVAKTGTYTVECQCSPVGEDGKVTRGRARLRIFVPKKNKNVPGHEQPNSLYGCYMTAVALETGFERSPRKLKPGLFELPNGEIITGDAVKAAYKKVDDATVAFALKAYNEKGFLVGRRFYGMIKHEQDKKDTTKVWAEVEKTRNIAVVPEGETVITSDFLVR